MPVCVYLHGCGCLYVYACMDVGTCVYTCMDLGACVCASVCHIPMFVYLFAYMQGNAKCVMVAFKEFIWRIKD